MSFIQVMSEYSKIDIGKYFASLTNSDIERIIDKDRLNALDYLALLSPRAEVYIEPMAQRAHKLTVQHFGKTILLFTPLYLSNYCVNQCLYCSFNQSNKMPRRKLALREVEDEAQIIAATGLKHLLILTGESRLESPVSYLVDCVSILKKHFTSIGIEVYPLTQEEYAELIRVGIDGLTIYQEVYNREVYDQVHLAGPKKNYAFRLEAPERALNAGIRTVNIGALLGLNDWREEAFFSGLHADYLQNKYPEAEISLSPPRIRPNLGGYAPKVTVTDKNLVQYILAFRIFMPRAGITISTRESMVFRNNLVPLGVTKMSAGSCTAVGGRAHASEAGQFDIADGRSVAEMAEMLYKLGYQPLYKDWQVLV